jgi:GNAT superfamily N-acetyltransferase
MYWRIPHGGKAWEALKGEPAKHALRRLIEGGKVQALIALNNNEAVGWLCFGPPADFPRIETVKALQHERDPATWVIVCFYLHPAWRRKGLGTRMLEAARDHAFGHGATIVEGYPVNVGTGAKMADAFAWTGVPPMFEQAGFTRLERAGETRGIWQAFRSKP